jgi:hypothetical protein
MKGELWIRKREMGNEDENDMENTSGYEISEVRHTSLGLEDPVPVILPA